MYPADLLKELSSTKNDLKRFLGSTPDYLYHHFLAYMSQGKMPANITTVFPVLRSVNYTGMSMYGDYYALEDADEAERYFNNPVLGEHLYTAVNALLAHEGESLTEIMNGNNRDIRCIHSSMTTFNCISPNDVFDKVLALFYNGKRDENTIMAMRMKKSGSKRPDLLDGIIKF